jgi:hypothetical protein
VPPLTTLSSSSFASDIDDYNNIPSDALLGRLRKDYVKSDDNSDSDEDEDDLNFLDEVSDCDNNLSEYFVNINESEDDI